MADDAGALLVRSGLVSSSALDEARSKVASLGGTIGEQLVGSGVVTDDALTDFYKSRLLVPQVNPNTLARLPAKVVAVIPSDMAIELRAIPVSLDAENNLTIAMSDPSDRHAVDEIAFFTGAYVVRAVATQMQIAWCLAHYYGHVTHLGQRLLQPTGTGTADRSLQTAVRPGPRPRGMTGRIEAARHRAIAPGAATDVARPAGALDSIEPEASASVPESQRARSISGEIRVAKPRAQSIKPPMPELDDDSGLLLVAETEPSGPADAATPEPSGPIITIERGEDVPDDEPARPLPLRRRRVKTDPPELAARAGEVDLKTGKFYKVDEEPAVVIADDAVPEDLASSKTTPVSRSIEVSGEIALTHRGDLPSAPNLTVEISDELSAPAMIHDHYSSAAPDAEAAAPESAPILLERKRPSDGPTLVTPPSVVEDDSDVLVLDSKKQLRRERNTQVGIGALTAATRAKHDTEVAGVPSEIEDPPTDSRGLDVDPTRIDRMAVPPGDYTASEDVLAAPPRPGSADDDTGPAAVAPPPSVAVPPPSGKVSLDNVRRAPSSAYDGDDDDDDDDAAPGRTTLVMSAIDLDAVIPARAAEVVPAHLEARRVDYDPVDDGWGPPGTTIPPPLLGAIPGSVTPASGIIPLPSDDSAPLMVAPPVAPEVGRSSSGSDAGLVRALEQATSRVLDLIRSLEHADDRDEVVATMIAHLAETHRRAGFFALRAGELQLFAIRPMPASMPAVTLRLDRPSTLQDVVGTRLPYRGPMHDDASRTFLASVLGASPPEILLVPVALRERVVGVLFGEHRMRHTFDDQLALAARAAGMALERILKAKRG